VSATDDVRSGWTWGGLGRAATIAGIALGTGGVLGYLVSHESPPRAAVSRPSPAPTAVRPHASEAELALLSPLNEGDSLGGFDIAEIAPIDSDGLLRITCRKNDAAVRLDVALAMADGGPRPPAVAGRYAVFYSLERGEPGDGQRLARALASIIEANAAVPIPPGLGSYPTGH
jgi:hypothetical protein